MAALMEAPPADDRYNEKGISLTGTTLYRLHISVSDLKLLQELPALIPREDQSGLIGALPPHPSQENPSMPFLRTLLRSTCLLTLCLGVRGTAFADSVTETGTFAADNTIFEYNLVVPTTSTYSFYTTSYGGGANLDGSTSLAGGFVPVLTLFNGSGIGLATAGASGMCGGGAMMDASTMMCDDASLVQTLTAGSYILALTEFPVSGNPSGKLSDGFLFQDDPNATGSFCGSGGQFLQVDTATCTQRNSSYALNITNASAVPEPPTWALVLPVAGVLFFAGRQQLS